VTVSAGPLSENALKAMRIQEYRKYFLGGWEREVWKNSFSLH
jgi:hypothetical protein